MKKIFMIAAVMLGFATVTACAQDTNTTPGDNNKMYQPRQFIEYAFEGILLEPEQQAKVDALNEQMRQQCDKPGCPIANGDSAQCPKVRNCDKPNCPKADGPRDGRGPRGMRKGGITKEYTDQLKTILTPEQYTTFLENIVFMPEQPGMQRGDRGPRGRMEAQGHRGEKCDKANCPNDKNMKKKDGKKKDGKKKDGKKSKSAKNAETTANN